MPNLGKNFYPKLVQVSSEVGMKPEDLIAVMISESGMNPSAVEKQYGAAGLIQFMPSTLRGLGFKGTSQDFSKLSGEEQLDWIKKLINGYKSSNGGRNFTSAAQYYTANFWPVALRLPGVRQENPDTAFIEKNPEIVTDAKGNKWSKKYYDIGIKIRPSQEVGAYKANPLFDKDKKGAITYGDMIKQVEINKRNPLYQKALLEMKQSSGYSPKIETQNKPEYIAMENTDQDLYSLVDNFLKEINASEKKLYKKFLPENNIIIKVNSNSLINSVEFSNILCSALNEELLADSQICSDGENIEINCSINGPKEICINSVKQLTSAISSAFKNATVKLGGISINTRFSMNKKSSYQQIDYDLIYNLHKNFLSQIKD